MFLYVGGEADKKAAIKRDAAVAAAQGKKVGVIDFDGDIADAARLFFKELRRCDTEGVEVILVSGVEEAGVGEAVMDRMRQAAEYKVINV